MPARIRTVDDMISNVSLISVHCLDVDASRDFYVDKLGFEVRADLTLGDGYRWTTVGHPKQPELEIHLNVPGPPLSDEASEFVRRQLQTGGWGGFGLNTDDCRTTHKDLVAKGVEFLQDPTDRPYGVEAVMRDNSGNWIVMVERREYSPADFD